jgi:H+-transporting ATPase
MLGESLIANPTIAGFITGACLLAFCTVVLAIGQYALHFSTEQVRTLTFIVLVFGSQPMIYAIGERKHLWSSRPRLWLLASSLADILTASTLAIVGLAMTPLPAGRWPPDCPRRRGTHRTCAHHRRAAVRAGGADAA